MNQAQKIFNENNVQGATKEALEKSVAINSQGNGAQEYIFNDGSILVIDACGMFVSNRKSQL